jgi:hypothetical protein
MGFDHRTAHSQTVESRTGQLQVFIPGLKDEPGQMKRASNAGIV